MGADVLEQSCARPGQDCGRIERQIVESGPRREEGAAGGDKGREKRPVHPEVHGHEQGDRQQELQAAHEQGGQR